MSQNSLIEVLEANHLLRSPDEVAAFEQALAELTQNPNPDDLRKTLRENHTVCKRKFMIIVGAVH